MPERSFTIRSIKGLKTISYNLFLNGAEFGGSGGAARLSSPQSSPYPEGRLSGRRSVPLCIDLMEKQSGTLRLHPAFPSRPLTLDLANELGPSLSK
jgi:hypothetical protein